MIAPPWYHLRYKDGLAFPPEVYATDEEYLADISKAVSEELDILYAAGVRNVQFDDPNFACKSQKIFEAALLTFRLLFREDVGWVGGRQVKQEDT